MIKILFTALTIIVLATSVGRTLASRTEIDAKQEAAATAMVAAPASSGPKKVVLISDSRGHFTADIQIKGAFIRTLVDTGASVVAMSQEDARKAGIDPRDAIRTVSMQTANGVVAAAMVRIPELRLQSIVVRNVDAVIMPPGAMSGTLLGMSFLKRLASFEMANSLLVLRQ